MHGLIINHEIIMKDLYKVEWINDRLFYEFKRKKILLDCEEYFYQWCIKNHYDVKKIKLLTALIYLNIAALHHYPYCLLLYGHGTKMLNELI